MTSFKIPVTHLRLFLTALDVNWCMSSPDYIFQVPGGFEIVYTKNEKVHLRLEIDKFVAGMWEQPALKNHSAYCDIDPETLTWRKDIPKGGAGHICFDCAARLPSGKINR